MKRLLCLSFAACAVLMAALTACTRSEEEESAYSYDIPGTTEVLTLLPERITSISAYLSGSVSMDVRGRITETGILLWSPGITTYDNCGIAVCTDPVPGGITQKISSPSVSEGIFYVELDGLAPNTVYRYAAFATNETGTFYGSERILVTSWGSVSDNEGNTYQAVRIGEQVWMRENLKSTVYADNSCITGCYQMKSDPDFGKRYSWSAANNAWPVTKIARAGGACPTGWHLPSDKEWQTMLTTIGISADQFRENLSSIDLIGSGQAALLKDADPRYWSNDGITNSTGFSVLPAEICAYSNNPACVVTAFWTSTPNIFYGFQGESEKIVRGYNTSSDCGFSVRCVRDRSVPD